MILTQISASAGSGKTYTLTRQFLDLLSEAAPQVRATGCALYGSSHSPVHERSGGYSLAEILAATFTNKAAAEMKARVVNGLKEEALRERAVAAPASGKNRTVTAGRKNALGAEAWVELVLRHYGSLNIRTIDSLLASLVRLSALELNLPPDFALSFDPDEYFTPVYDALMDDLAGSGPVCCDPATLRARLSEACRALLHLHDFRGFTPKGHLRGLLLELVDRMLRGKDMPRMDSGAIHARLSAMHADMTDACRAMLESLEREELAASAHYLRFLQNCVVTGHSRAVPDSAYRHKSSLDDCLNKASRGAASVQAERAFVRVRTAVDEYSAVLPLFRHALQLAPLSELARELFIRVRERQDNLLPAPCLPALAGDLLSGDQGVSDALCRLGTRLSRILLDEFQDTSREQWRAILPLAEECLATGGSLTLVGDVKQAIYGWRGGDARLFDEAVAEPGLNTMLPEGPRCDSLKNNWRSHPTVVDHNNAFFTLLGHEETARGVLAAMLPKHTPESYREQAAEEVMRHYGQAAQGIPAQNNWGGDPKSPLAGVRLYQVNAPTVSEVQELVRARLQTLLLDELLPHWNCGDIAILVRSGDEAALTATWLSAWGLPVVTENSFLLATHPLVGRLISFLSFLDYPLDDLAFWEAISGEILRGAAPAPGRGMIPLHPLCGEAWRGSAPPNNQLDDWLAEVRRMPGSRNMPLYRHFRRNFPALWERYIEPFYSGAGLMGAYDTLLEAVKRFGVLERMPEQAPFVRRLLELAHLAENRGHSSLAAFLAFWRGCQEDEKLPLPEHMDAIRIMTIHKAKGLEFPVVILPFQHKGLRRDPELVVTKLHGLDLLTRAGSELPEHYYPACITEELERLNLLYVAWTRPKYALHSFITRPDSAPGPLPKALEVLASAYRQEYGDSLCQWETLDAGNVPDVTENTSMPPRGAGLQPDQRGSVIEQQARAEGIRPEASIAGVEAKVYRPMMWLPRLKIYRSPLPEPRFTPRSRGILAHLCLEHLIISGQGTVAENITRAVRLGLRLFPLPLDNPDRIAAEMRDAIAWFASLPEAPLWLAHGLREQGIMDAKGRIHRVDLLVEGEDGSLAAVDYKTGQAEEGHQGQVRRYMRLAGEATGRPVRGFLVYLDERRLLEVLPEGNSP